MFSTISWSGSLWYQFWLLQIVPCTTIAVRCAVNIFAIVGKIQIFVQSLKELYTSTNNKLYEGHHTPATFNLHYDSLVFIIIIPHPLLNHFKVLRFLLLYGHIPHHLETICMHGVAISVPVLKHQPHIPNWMLKLLLCYWPHQWT
jgi:hypothetical protein